MFHEQKYVSLATTELHSDSPILIVGKEQIHVSKKIVREEDQTICSYRVAFLSSSSARFCTTQLFTSVYDVGFISSGFADRLCHYCMGRLKY